MGRVQVTCRLTSWARADAAGREAGERIHLTMTTSQPGARIAAVLAAGLCLAASLRAHAQDLDLDLEGELDQKFKKKESRRKAAEKAARDAAERKKRAEQAAVRKKFEIAAELKKRLVQAGGKGCESVVFMTGKRSSGIHYYENISYACNSGYHPGGGKNGAIKKLDLRTGKVTTVFSDPEGSMHDLRVHYSGKKLLFSYMKPGPKPRHFHLYEVDVDGKNLRQLTNGGWDDIEPCYLPNGDIVFSSTRSKRWVPCWNTQVATIFRCGPNGENIRPLSAAVEMENTPFVMSDGRVLYTRWEYVDRSQMTFHHLWTFNPDGSGVMVYYGNERPWYVMIDGQSIPGTRKVLSTFSGGHGSRFRHGYMTIVDPGTGPSALAGAQRLVDSRGWREPCPVTSDVFLAAAEGSIVLLDDQGRYGPIYTPKERDEGGAWDPRPLRPRPREPVIPDRVNWEKSTGTLVLADAYHGRKMQGVKRGDIRKILILEELPKPVNFSGGRDQISLHGTYMLHRIIGTVPVEKDGSAHFTVPALRSLFFVTLDENDMSVKRMQSFTTVMPGETTSCVGCHEHRYENPKPTGGAVLAALARPPSEPEYPKAVPDVIDFPRDVQPILDRCCLKCHDVKGKRAGNVTLNGDRGAYFSHSFFTLWAYGQLSDGQNAFGNMPPRTIGTAASPLMKKIDGSHHGVKLSKRDRDTVRLWVESSCVYAGTYAALGTRPIGVGSVKIASASSDELAASAEDGELDEAAVAAAQDGVVEISSKALDDIMRRRRSGCHGFQGGIYRGLDGSYRHEMRIDKPKARYNKSLLYSLTRPGLSRALLAPLAREAGGWGLCKGAVKAYPGKPVWWRPRKEAPKPKVVKKPPKRVKSIDDDLSDLLGDKPKTATGNGMSLKDKPKPVQPLELERRAVPAVFADKNDPDYVLLHRMIAAAGARLKEVGSFDVPGFRPNPHYVREMKRFDILPANYEKVSKGRVVDVYAIDRAYWRSLWWPCPQPHVLDPGEFLREPSSSVAMGE